MKLPNLENWSTGEQTKIKSDSKVEEILSHELVHMFDYCTKKINFDQIKNPLNLGKSIQDL